VLAAERTTADLLTLVGDDKFFRHHYIPRIFYKGKTSAKELECKNVKLVERKSVPVVADAAPATLSKALKQLKQEQSETKPEQKALFARFTVSCPGMFRSAGEARVFVPKYGFAVEGGKSMLRFDESITEKPSYVHDYKHFEVIKSYANRLCRVRTVSTDCPPKWQCCSGTNDFGNKNFDGHCGPLCIS